MPKSEYLDDDTALVAVAVTLEVKVRPKELELSGRFGMCVTDRISQNHTWCIHAHEVLLWLQLPEDGGRTLATSAGARAGLRGEAI